MQNIFNCIKNRPGIIKESKKPFIRISTTHSAFLRSGALITNREGGFMAKKYSLQMEDDSGRRIFLDDCDCNILYVAAFSKRTVPLSTARR